MKTSKIWKAHFSAQEQKSISIPEWIRIALDCDCGQGGSTSVLFHELWHRFQ